VLRLSEVYTSTQGEGPNTGLPVQFVRFAGCNLRCPGWPCDTPFAIEPAIWRHEAKQLTPAQVLSYLEAWPRRLCLTGGEPFVQPLVDLQEFVRMARNAGYTLECFSNGTRPYPTWALRDIQFTMDWKLTGSGEADQNVDVRWMNIDRLHPSSGVKFVVKDELDLEEAKDLTPQIVERNPRLTIWVGTAWATVTDKDIVDYIIEHQLPWRHQLQTHKYIWPPELRGV
jgi:7-carboxy-7-deazaguanine synthase